MHRSNTVNKEPYFPPAAPTCVELAKKRYSNCSAADLKRAEKEITDAAANARQVKDKDNKQEDKKDNR